MLTKGSILQAPVDFDNAMLFGIPVEVWQFGRRIDVGGVITKHTEDAVYLDDADDAFGKELCQFRVR